MKREWLGTLVVGAAMVLGGSPARASLVVYSGADSGAGMYDARPNSDLAASTFATAAAALGPTSTITFESAALGSFSNLTVAPGVTIKGQDVNGNNQTIRNTPYDTPSRLFGYNTTAGGSRFAFLYGGSLTFTFTSAIQAFGAYITGVQQGGETITFSDGTQQTVQIPGLPLTDGGATYVAFTDAGKSIVSVKINVDARYSDYVGVDDVRYTLATVATPEPSTLAIAGLGGLGLLGYVRRSRKQAA